MRRPDTGSAIGLILFILVIVGATAALMIYKKYDAQTVLLFATIGVAILFLIGILFTGIKLPGTRPVRQAAYWRNRHQKLLAMGLITK